MARKATIKEQSSSRPIAVPVVIDDIKRMETFQMARCSYFCIQADTPSPDWILDMESISIPFVMLGLSGIIVSPSLKEELFKTPDSFDKVFDRIDSHKALYVDTEDIWLPIELFGKQELGRGNVYRVDLSLFQLALLFRTEVISQNAFTDGAREISDAVQYSATETKALRKWSEGEIEKARTDYQEHPELRLKRIETGPEA
jgi:hypothetical protein